MNTQVKVCAVCKENLTLSRREVHAITMAVKSVVNDRFFVPDDEVHQIIHRVHTQKEVAK